MWKRRAVTVLLVAIGTAVGLLWWLHDGDLVEAITPMLSSPNAPQAP